MTAPPLIEKQTHRIAALDGLRGIAVLCVLFQHAGFGAFQGSFGVDLFFVLSGYLITWLLVREIDRTGAFKFGAFYMRRILRLVPALTLMVAGTLLALYLLKFPMHRYLKEGLLALSYMMDWSYMLGFPGTIFLHAWSLGIEEQFYLLWPWLAVLLAMRYRPRAFGICFALALLVEFYRLALTLHHASFDRLYFPLDTRGDSLLLGAAFAFWRPRLPKKFAGIIGLLLLFLGIAIFSLADHTRHNAAAYLLPISLILSAGTVLSVLCAPEGFLSSLLSWKCLVWIGQISYGLYLYHYPFAWLTSQYRPTLQPLCIPVAFLVAVPSFYLVERPLLRLKSKFGSQG